MGATDVILPSGAQSKVEPFKEKLGQRFVVRCESVSFNLVAPIDGDKGPLGQVEPYLTTLALYDIKANKKITEDFHFDVNQPHARALLQSSVRQEGGDSAVSPPIPEVPSDWLAFPKQVKTNSFFIFREAIFIAHFQLGFSCRPSLPSAIVIATCLWSFESRRSFRALWPPRSSLISSPIQT